MDLPWWGHVVTWRSLIGGWDIWKEVIGLWEDSCVAFTDLYLCLVLMSLYALFTYFNYFLSFFLWDVVIHKFINHENMVFDTLIELLLILSHFLGPHFVSILWDFLDWAHVFLNFGSMKILGVSMLLFPSNIHRSKGEF